MAGCSTVQVLGVGERAQIVAGWNDTAAVVAAGSAGELVGVQVARVPDATAVVCGEVSLSYGELFGRACRLAWFLREAGAGPESVVGLCLGRGPELVAAVLGVWLAGAAYLPLDPAYPAGRLGFMLADSRAALVVGTADVLDELPAGRVRAIALDDPLVGVQVGAMPAVPPAVRVAAGQLAYVMYTSGSTGTPKGVQVTHGGLGSLAAAQAERFAAGPGARVLAFASPGFDASVWELVMALCGGAVLVTAGAGEVLAGQVLAGVVARQGVVACDGAARLLLAVTAVADLGPVRVLVTGG